jgi:hypothetical protein
MRNGHCRPKPGPTPDRCACAVELAAYADTNFGGYLATGLSHVWLQPRLDALGAVLESRARLAAFERGTHLDRRRFMRLLADAEGRITGG